MFQIYLMPEEKEKGSHNKWIEGDILEGRRKDLAKYFAEKYPSGSWKLRKV